MKSTMCCIVDMILSGDRFRKLFCVGILLESHYSSFPHTHDMCELCTHLLTSRFVCSTIGTEYYYTIPGIEPLLRCDRELHPIGPESHEHPFEHRLRPDVRIPIRIDKILCFIPLDALVHASECCRNIATT